MIDAWLESKVRMWVDDNEHFLGEELDEKKMERLNALRERCRKIGELDHSIKYTAHPFSNRDRNGCVFLDFPDIAVCDDKRVCGLLAQAFADCDDFSTSTMGGGLRITFGIHDMWTKFGYDNDLEHGK